MPLERLFEQRPALFKDPLEPARRAALKAGLP